MAIAIIGWGSLIWSPGSLVLGSRWFKDGPTLPLEFARISNRDRATLVISEFGSPQRTYWVYASSDNPDSVVSELGRREGTRRIDFTLSDGTVSQGRSVQTGSSMSQWLAGHPELHACVWTGLGSNWIEKRGQAFSVEDALKYLTERPDASEAKEYIQKAPAQIQTPLRQTVRERLGWVDADLPDDLFAGT